MTATTVGRPPATSHLAIEMTAFGLFEDRGFEATTMDDIAEAVGVGRRTLFRYYPSKNDILWGQFDESLEAFRATFAALPTQIPIAAGIREAMITFNTFGEAVTAQHRRRMRLLLGTPALLAHSELRYAAWRAVVAGYVAQRLTREPDELAPRAAGRVALAVAIAAYEEWLRDDALDLTETLALCTRQLELLLVS